MKILFFILISFTLSCGSSKKADGEKKPLATKHSSGDICNALTMKRPIVFPKTPIGTSENLIVQIFIEKQHELKNINASGLYEPLGFYGSGFPGIFPENTHRPCGQFLSSADEAANYCHVRLKFNPHQRIRYKRKLTFNYTINGNHCTRVVDVLAEGF